MNLILGLLMGALIGWVAFTLLRLNTRQGLRTSVLIGVIGGGIGMQLAPMVSAAPVVEGQLNVFALVIAAAMASAALIIASMVASRRGG
jgi:uncharacterized membrane protein YeaQ/YmgE (transglycosylase-associated protein family)